MQTRGMWTISSILLLLFGIVLVVVGAYFWFIRPPLLPEDLHYLATSPAKIDAAAPNLKAWLTHVFRVLGGYITASGILTIALAATSYREHRATAAVAAAAAGAASIGLMTAVNFSIDSDFRWILLAIAVLWTSSIVMYAVESLRTARSGGGPRTLASFRGYERQYSQAVLLRASAAEVFEFADDFARLSSHMGSSSMMMMGSGMQTSFDESRGQAIGSHIKMTGRMLGLDLFLEEIVRVREPPRRKEWETVGTPRLLVIGGYRLGFEIASIGERAELRVFIGYDLPSSPARRLLGRFFGPVYARWCVREMVNGARAQFDEAGTEALARGPEASEVEQPIQPKSS
jgi:uncharacterized membrane protein YphA (DoxX/SURF4 family)